ncbi:MAG: rhodanese-like domain-containing protein, partial [Chloroflexi bacterium]|nr:rhodanese-like domain-containing protein [Chloroflexota bacterium]
MRIGRVSPAAALALAQREEAVLLDLREPAAFARGHPAGALSVLFSPRGLGLRARAALPPGAAVVLVAPDEGTGEAAAVQLVEAGVAVRGILEGGSEAWRAARLPEAAVSEVAVDELPRLAEVATVVDVREPLEWATGHVPGALLIPLGRLREAIPSVPRDRPVVAICEAGVRSCTAASILA